MTKSQLFRLAALATLLITSLFACKKEKNPGTPDAEHFRPIYEISQTLNDLQTGMVAYSREGLDANAALIASLEDLEDSENVSQVYHIDSSYAYITMNSGVEVTYFLVPEDENGKPLYRGSNGTSGAMQLLSEEGDNEITNKKILLFNAAEFKTSSEARKILKDNTEKYQLEVTEKSGEACTYELVSSFGDYGLVVLNTHGMPNGFQIGSKLPVTIQDGLSDLSNFAAKFNSNASRSIADRILVDQQLGIAVGKHYDPKVPIHNQNFISNNADSMEQFVKSKQIAKLDFSTTIIVGNMCYSGFDNTALVGSTNLPILEGFRQAKTRAYFGYQQAAKYSTTVNTEVAEKMEEHLFEGFFNENDSTGNVHLDDNNQEQFDVIWAENARFNRAIRKYGNLYFRQFFADNYCYPPPCSDPLEDPRDKQVYKVVCIGDQIWMAENLNYKTGNSWCYDNNPALCDSLGRLYDRQTALVACPAGWHLPSEAEWQELIDTLGGYTVAGGKLKATTGWLEPDIGATNSSGFNAYASGVYTKSENSFQGIGLAGVFWSTDISDAGNPRNLILSRYNTNGYVTNSGVQLTDGVPCRCIKDK